MYKRQQHCSDITPDFGITKQVMKAAKPSSKQVKTRKIFRQESCTRVVPGTYYTSKNTPQTKRRILNFVACRADVHARIIYTPPRFRFTSRTQNVYRTYELRVLLSCTEQGGYCTREHDGDIPTSTGVVHSAICGSSIFRAWRPAVRNGGGYSVF